MTTIHPEQARALAYLRRRGTESDPEELRARLTATLGRLERRLEELDAEAARRRPDEGTWCVQEIVNHLTVSLEPGTRQLRALSAGEPPGEPIAAGLLESDALTASWPEARERLREVHSAFLAAVDEAIRLETPLERKVPAVMVVKVDDGSGEAVPLEWIDEIDWKSFALIPHVHTFEHLDQIRRVVERLEAT